MAICEPSFITMPSNSSVFLIIIICYLRKKKETKEQTDPPTIPIADLFPQGNFPEGEIQQYKDE